MRRDGHRSPSWGEGNTAHREIRTAEIDFEREVSRVIGAMSFVYLSIEDEPGPDSLRGVIERNAVALLSNMNKVAVYPPAADWLGHYSDRERVQRSGLWNQNHVEGAYDPAFLDLLGCMVAAQRRLA